MPETIAKPEWFTVRTVNGRDVTWTPFATFAEAWAARGPHDDVQRIREGRCATAAEAAAQARWDWGWGSDAEFCTRDGVTLTKRVHLPQLATFDDVFEAWEPWDDATMSARNGGYTAEGQKRRAPYTVHLPGGTELGPYCSVDLSQIGGGSRFGQSLAVRPTQEVREALAGLMSMDDRASWKLIAHKATGRVLVIAQHGFISGGPWVAYIDPDTVPRIEA